MKQSNASRKTNEQAREVIANILLFEISDPRLHLVTITGCEVSFDRSVCNVFYSVEPDRYEETKAAFEGAKGRIRSLMAQKLSWRVAPELRFHLDTSVDQAQTITAALKREGDRLSSESGSDREAEQSEESLETSEDPSSTSHDGNS